MEHGCIFMPYSIHSFTGELLDIQSETLGISIIRTEQTFFLQNRDGKELVINLGYKDVSARRGHTLSFIWAVRKGKETGKYIVAYNHNLDKTTLFHSEISSLTESSAANFVEWIGAIIAVLGFLSCIVIAQMGVGYLISLILSIVLTVFGLGIFLLVKHKRKKNVQILKQEAEKVIQTQRDNPGL